MDLHADLKRKKEKKDRITLMKSPIFSAVQQSGFIMASERENHHIDVIRWLALALAGGWLKLDESCSLKQLLVILPVCTTEMCKTLTFNVCTQSHWKVQNT